MRFSFDQIVKRDNGCERPILSKNMFDASVFSQSCDQISQSKDLDRGPFLRAGVCVCVLLCFIIPILGEVAGLFRVSSDLCAGFGWGDRSNQPPIGEKVFNKMISEESRVEVRKSAKDK